MMGQNDNSRSHILNGMHLYLQWPSIKRKSAPVFVTQTYFRCIVWMHKEARIFFNLLDIFGIGRELFRTKSPVHNEKVQAAILPAFLPRHSADRMRMDFLYSFPD